MEVKIVPLLYEDLKKGLTFEHDNHGVLSYQYETRREALLANPNLADNSVLFMAVGTADDDVIACSTRFMTLFKHDEVITEAMSGTYFYVINEFRKDPIGAELFLYRDKNHKVDVSIASGVSEMALPFHKVAKRVIFYMPKFWQIRNINPIINNTKLKGVIGSVLSFIFNVPLFCIKRCQLSGRRGMLKRYSIESVERVPEWIDEITLNDGHKYMEVHDHKWLQWNLDYNFCGGNNNYQKLYILKREGNPVGFFMLKYRRYSEIWRMKDSTISSLVEWGIKEGEPLTELDIIRLASKTIGNTADILEVATSNTNLAKVLRWRLFKPMGNANISVKNYSKQPPDFKDMDLWRLRLGYADVILST